MVREGPGDIVVKLTDEQLKRVPRKIVVLPYTFDGFQSNDEFLVYEMNYAYDCILRIPWLSRYQSKIDWLSRSVKRRSGYDVSEVFTHLLVASSDWPHVRVVNELATTSSQHIESDGPLCAVWSVTLTEPHNEAVEQRFPHTQTSVEQGFLILNEAVEQGLPLPMTESVCALEYVEGSPHRGRYIEVASPPCTAADITSLPDLTWKDFLHDLKAGDIEQVCIVSATEAASEEVLEARPKSAEHTSAREERFAAQSWDALRASGSPVYNIAREYADIFPEKISAELPADRGVRHEIDLVPGSKYCVTWQRPLPRDQVIAIDEFFDGRRKAGHVRESISPHSSPTFCVKKATGGWRIVHAFNKLNEATIPAQTPIPRKDMVLNTMSGSEIYSAIDLTDGFYQILMRDSDIPFTAVSTPSGMLWEWLVMPQGLKNAPATFNRMVTQVLRPLRDFAPSYFDDIFVHSRAEQKLSATEVHLRHLKQVFQVMRENKLYANLKKCVFCAPEIPVLGCYVSKEGVRADPEKISSICSWPTPRNQTELRQWLGLANYLHKYTKNYAELIQPLSTLLKKDAVWLWTAEHQSAFDSVKKSLSEAPVLMLPDDSKPFHVVCDASNFAIGCALMQFDDEGRERVVSFQSRQMKPAEKNYPVHDKELLAMRYALIKFRVYLLGEKMFSIYTDHASLRTAVKSPHLSQRMARWLSFFAEYNFVVHYKPGKNNILADALSRRPDYDPRRDMGHQTEYVDDDEDICVCCIELGLNAMISTPVLSIRTQIAESYANDSFYAGIINYLRDPSEKLLAKLTKPKWERYHQALRT
ncbi:unnamed protein product [Peronospora farinosa]|uniref:Reverse transcriptase domain-containing protein n=2 Tax=Peronospora farinosa TaxID=134698 RepID=A0ABN8BW81_9STRA|nr:unnamed protein product [Peronospora farinosa]